VLPATQIIVPNIPGHNHDIDKKPYPYDPAKAKQLLAEAKADGVPVDKEIMMFSYPVSFPAAAELMDGFYTMYKNVGLNVKLKALEAGEYAKWNTRPFPDNRQVAILQTLHDNITGDPYFSLSARYGCDGNNSVFCDPDIDKRIARMSAAEGDARARETEEIFKRLHEDIVADVVLYHMIAFTQVSKRIKYVPDLTISAQIRLQEIAFP
jgi:peptide/nickel transport system substrate-binding protein